MVTRALRKNGDVSIIFSIVNIITVLNDSIKRFLELDLFMKYNCHFLRGHFFCILTNYRKIYFPDVRLTGRPNG